MATLIAQEQNATWVGNRLAHLNDRVTALLQEIQPTDGAQGAFVCDNHGATLGALVNASFDRDLYDRIGLCVAQSFAMLQGRSTQSREIEFSFANKVMLARDLGNAFVVIICAPQANRSLVRMAVNVAAAPFEKDAELQIGLKQAAPSRSDTLAEKYMDQTAWQLVLKAGLPV